MSAGVPAGAGIATADAYRHCEVVTRAQAKNFYYGIRLLAGERRRAMCAVYAFARRVDDIGDGSLERDEKLRRLDAEARSLASLGGSSSLEQYASDPVFVALADVRERFSLPLDVLGDLIDGVRMDVEEVRYERFEDLVVYCRHVAGAIGRACLAIFGASERGQADGGEAQALADDLGVALQLTNILRDLREDAANGRVYLPAEDLLGFGVIDGEHGSRADVVLARLTRSSLLAPASPAPPPGESEDDARAKLAALVRFEAQRAQAWFDRGLTLVPLLDRRSAACVLAMAGIYHELLERIAARPEGVLSARMSLPPWQKAWVAVTSMVAAQRGRRTGRASAGEPIGGRP